MARIRIQLLGQQTLFSNQSSMIKFAKETLEPILLEIFKDADKDIYLIDYAVTLNVDTPDDWTNWSIKEVAFKSFSDVLYEEAVLYFKNGVNVTIAAMYSGYRQILITLPSINDVIKYTLKYANRPINFIGPDSKPMDPGSLLKTMIHFYDMEGTEIVGNTYGAEVGAALINDILSQQLSKEEVNGELVAWLLEFKKQHFGFDGSQDLPAL